MRSFGRRGFFSTLAISAVPSFAHTLKTIGVQLYTVRGVLPRKPLETLKALEAIGYQEAELVGESMDAIWPSLTQTSLKPVSVHLDTALFTTNQAKLPAALEDAKKRGLAYVVCPYIELKDRGGADMIKRLAENLNQAGELCKQSGLACCYHNHAFEFAPSGDGILLDLLMQFSDPKLVSLELDIMWAQVGGKGPLSVLKKYGERVKLMHLKNVAPGFGPQFNENVPKTAFREVGGGVIDIPAVLRAAEKAGVEHYFVEQDETPGDPLVSLRGSFEYLKNLDF